VTTRLIPRLGFTLAELIAVVAILGIVSAVAISRFEPGVFNDVGSHSDARRLAIEMLAAQRRAIATGDSHRLDFATANDNFTGYVMKRVTPGGPVVVDTTRSFPRGLIVSGSHSQAEFTFEGSALAAYQYTLAGSNRTWDVQVIPATGMVRVREP
jgi:prepilin-type N-terminal cleavage/methylation domain-containing protein